MLRLLANKAIQADAHLSGNGPLQKSGLVRTEENGRGSQLLHHLQDLGRGERPHAAGGNPSNPRELSRDSSLQSAFADTDHAGDG